jgi:hypothetical protein
VRKTGEWKNLGRRRGRRTGGGPRVGDCLRAGRRSCSTATDRESNSDSDDDDGGGGNLRRRVSRCFRTPRSLARGLVDEEGPIARERRTGRDGTTTLNCWRYGGTEMTRFATHGENCAERESHVVILATATVFRLMTRHISPRCYSYALVRALAFGLCPWPRK